MKRAVVIVVALIFLLALLSYTVTYTVRFTESAVLTTFGKAGDGAIKSAPGLYAKWPSPIQAVTKYDTRTRFLQARSQTQQTADQRQVIVEAYCTWRVTDPLKFFQKFSNAGDRSEEHFRKAEDSLQSSLRSAIGATSRFAMSDLFTPVKGGTKIPDLEKAILGAMTTADGASLDSFGLKVEDVGVSRIMLPEDTTKEVFKRMGANRDKVAQDIASQGEAAAQSIRTSARSAAETIRNFAQFLAQDIRNQGEMEATKYLKEMRNDEKLAVFLRSMDFFKVALARRTTLVFSTSTPGFGLMSPDALNSLKAGDVPSTGIEDNFQPALSDVKAAPRKPAPAQPAAAGGGK